MQFRKLVLASGQSVEAGGQGCSEEADPIVQGRDWLTSWESLEDKVCEQKQRPTRAMGRAGIGVSTPIPA